MKNLHLMLSVGNQIKENSKNAIKTDMSRIQIHYSAELMARPRISSSSQSLTFPFSRTSQQTILPIRPCSEILNVQTARC